MVVARLATSSPKSLYPAMVDQAINTPHITRALTLKKERSYLKNYKQ